MTPTLHTEHRKDWRTDEQFARDIKVGNDTEREIIERFATHLRRTYDCPVKIEDNGVDNTGRPLRQSEVTTSADFKVNGMLVEVKFINPLSQNFRFKSGHLDSCIRQGAIVLFVNGWQTPRPEFVLMDDKQLRKIRETVVPREYEPWGYKLCYFLTRDMFKWTTLKK
jgi:hypothetical protein